MLAPPLVSVNCPVNFLPVFNGFLLKCMGISIIGKQ